VNELVLAAAVTYFALACGFDLKKRIVPDWLNYGAIAVAFALAAWLGLLSPEFAAGVATAFVFAYLLYRIGAWAGGDAKFFTGATAFLLLAVPAAGATGFATFFFNSICLSLPLVVFLHLKGLWGLRKELTGLVKPALFNGVKTGLLGAAGGIAFVKAIGVLTGVLSQWVAYAIVFLVALAIPLPVWLAAVVFAAGAFFDWQSAATLFAVAFAVGFAGFYFFKAFSLVSTKLLRKNVAAKDLREGMISAETIFLKDGKPVVRQRPSLAEAIKAVGKLDARALQAFLARPAGRIVADSSKARGLTEGEIKELKAAGVTSLETKESLAFAPILAAGWVASVLWGLSWLAP